MQVKAIDTHYSGHYFRSRLEARWAVYFDRLGIKWMYEFDGYKLASGNYLPDFYLPDHDLFCEVKPPTYKIHDDKRWVDLVEIHKKPLMLLNDIPSLNSFDTIVTVRDLKSDEFFGKTDCNYLFCDGVIMPSVSKYFPVFYGEYVSKYDYSYKYEKDTLENLMYSASVFANSYRF